MARGYDDRSSATRNRYKGASTLKLEDLADYLQGECGIITSDVEELLEKNANTLADKIEADSPKDTGEYSSGWIVTERQKPGKVEFVVRNIRKYRLTHLLEKGHDLKDKNGVKYGEVPPKPHINDNADQAIRECSDGIDKILKKVTQ